MKTILIRSYDSSTDQMVKALFNTMKRSEARIEKEYSIELLDVGIRYAIEIECDAEMLTRMSYFAEGYMSGWTVGRFQMLSDS